jgi:hypothetical protein
VGKRQRRRRDRVVAVCRGAVQVIQGRERYRPIVRTAKKLTR